MKKYKLQLCIVALFAVLAIACTGCSGGGNAYRLYQAGVEHFNETDDIDMSMVYTLNLGVGDYSSETKMKADVMGVDLDSNPVYLLYYDTTIFGTTVNTEVYYADNVAYVDTGDSRYKQTLSFDELMEEHGGPVLQMDDLEQFMKLAKEDFDVATTTSEGGITKISVTLPGEKFQNIIADYFQNTMGSSGSFGMYTENLTLSDLVMTFSLNQENYFTGMTLDTDITLNMDSSASLYSHGNRSFSMALKMEITFNNPGSPVEIVPPNGLDQYKEYQGDNGR